MVRVILFAFIIIASLTMTGAGALAQELAVVFESAPETRIVVDDEAGVIRFFVKGVEQARLTSDGLIVRGDVTYGGVMRDAGEEAMKEPDQEDE